MHRLQGVGCRQNGATPPALLWLAVVAGTMLSPSGLRADEPAAAAVATPRVVTFEEDIVPILEARCFKCHGAEMRKAGLDLRRRFAIVAGGDSGASVVPGKPDESLLIELIVEGTMPPKEEGRLDEKQIALLKSWVAGGALIAAKEEPPLEVADKGESAVSEADRQFWSFQPPVRPEIPVVKAIERVRTPIDALLLAKLEAKGLSFNPDAEQLVLLRRVCFDLLGLPPTLEQVQEFLADTQPGAYERLVDRLLLSPQYGERWGRHWLDVAGYADSDGYLEADRDRPEAYRYRDYVIRALNQDKPYSQFLIEQIAGDELSNWRQAAELTPEMQEQLIATGFMRTASDPTYAGYKEKLECYKVMADTTQIVSSALLGVTLQCARCHSHKSDPFTQRDYYQLHAVFLPAYDPDRWQVSLERAIPLATEAQSAKVTQHNKLVDQRLAYLNGEVAELLNRHREKLLAEKSPALAAEVREKVKAALLVEEAKRNEEQKQLVAANAPGVSLKEDDLAKRFPELAPELDALRKAIAAETGIRKQIVQLRGLMDLYSEQPTAARVLRRGDFNNLGQAVEPAVPAVLVPAEFQFQPQPGYKTTGRRLAFAKWLTDPKHPLTARVQVNRIWAHHFGRGIVPTLDDFGHNGDSPSHPELLDWLATEFIALGWSQKALHRLILLSTAYRQTSDVDSAKLAGDPDNVLLGSWAPQRHEGEVIRDTLLALSGRLNPEMFGVPVAVARQGDGTVIVADTTAGNRRSVYLKVRRSEPVTLLELFDTPRMEVNCTRRTEAIVATQALTLLNSKFVEVHAQGLRDRIVQLAGVDQRQRIETAYKIVLCRAPTSSERQAIDEFLAATVQEQLGANAATAASTDRQAAVDSAWGHVCQALLNCNEFLFVH